MHQKPSFSRGLWRRFTVADGSGENDVVVGVEELGDVFACFSLDDVGGCAYVDQDDAEEVEGGVHSEDGVEACCDGAESLSA